MRIKEHQSFQVQRMFGQFPREGPVNVCIQVTDHPTSGPIPMHYTGYRENRRLIDLSYG
jgi:hypothetical protein